MPVLPRALEIQGEISTIRRDIHAHPELAFEENRTSDIVAAKLQEWGFEVTRGLGKTGVVGTLRKGNSVKSIGLRADMDCLPMDETNDFEHRSQNAGRMHACGHDGHTAMLLGAAKMLSETKNFEGAVHCIFQPAEEGGGGAKVMIDDGLFEKFPCDAVFAIHNKPGLPVGHIVAKGGPILASADRWDIRITGRGGHAAHPHSTLDPMVVGANIILALQTIVSRNIDPIEPAVATVGFFNAGSAYNVIPGGAAYRRHDAHDDAAESRAGEAPHRRDLRGAARMHGVEIEVEHKPGYPPTVNDVERARFALDVAAWRLRRACRDRQGRLPDGRGGLFLHAGEGAGRHGVAG